MTNNSFPAHVRAGLLFGPAAVTALLFAGCAYDNPNRPVVYQEQSPATVVVAQDDYVYYPEYQVYYSNSRHQYGYRDGNAWAWRPAPPNVSVNLLVSSPSVRMDFHDSPEQHHNAVVKSYPRNWKPQPDKNQKAKDDHRDDKKDDHKDDRKDGDRNH